MVNKRSMQSIAYHFCTSKTSFSDPTSSFGATGSENFGEFAPSRVLITNALFISLQQDIRVCFCDQTRRLAKLTVDKPLRRGKRGEIELVTTPSAGVGVVASVSVLITTDVAVVCKRLCSALLVNILMINRRSFSYIS